MTYHKDYSIPHWTLPLGQIEIQLKSGQKLIVKFLKDKDSDWMFAKFDGHHKAAVRSKTWAGLLTRTGQIIKDSYENN